MRNSIRRRKSVIKQAASQPNQQPQFVLKELTRVIRRALLLPASMLLLQPGMLLAAPEGGNIVDGSGTISTPNTTTTLIQQNSNSMVVEWQSFNVDRQELVRFEQPDASSAVLNRILDQNPSQIFGRIEANGKVFLANPNGFIFGKTAVINVSSFFAVAKEISASRFMRGDYSEIFSDYAEAGQVINEGIISAETGGTVFLSGSVVNNSGIIKAGSIDDSGGEIRLIGIGGSVANSGTLDASGSQGGSITLMGDNVEHSGTIRADGFAGNGGTIEIIANDTTLFTGDSYVSATSAEGEGGTIHILGDQVGLFDNSSVDASGDLGGGEVLIGGDYQGNNADIKNAKGTYISANSRIKADAIINGDGGKVVVWSDEIAAYYGDISAKGGAESGSGGSVEVSGKEMLLFRGDVDTSAANGDVGTLLLDPATLTITDETNTSVDHDDELTTTATVGEILEGVADSGGNTVSWGAIDSLAATTAITLEATGLITINDVDGTADGTITSNDLVTLDLTTGSLTITSTGGAITFADTNDVIRTEGGAITLQAQGGDLTAGGFNTTGNGGGTSGAVNLEASGNIALSALDGGITTGSGSVTLNAGGSITTAANATAEIKTTGAVDLTADAIGATNTLDIDGATTLTINDTGAGDIRVDELVAATIASTNITVADATSGNIDISYFNGDAVDINSGHLLNSVDLNQNVSSFSYTATTGDISITTIDAGTGTVSLTSTAGSITESASDTLVDITASDLTLTADGNNQAIGGASVAALDVALTGDLSASANTGTGGIFVNETVGDISVASLDAGSTAVELTAVTSIDDATANVDAVTDITAATVSLKAASGVGATADLELSGTSNLTIDTDGSFEVVTDTVLTDLTLTVNPSTATNSTYLLSDGSMTFTLADNGADVDVTDVSAVGNLNFGLTTETGDINVTTIGAGAGTVSLTATAGSLLDNGSNITAGDLNLIANAASAAIGGSGAEINTALSGSLTASANNSTGGIFINQTGDLIIGAIDADVTSGGDVEITTTGTMGTTAAADIVGNNVTLTLAADNLLTVDANTSITGESSVALVADEMDLNSAGGDLIKGGTTLSLRAVENGTQLKIGTAADVTGTGAAGTLGLDATDLAALDDSSGAIEFGSATINGATLIDAGGAAVTINAPLTIYSDSFGFAVAGDAVVSDASVSLDAEGAITDVVGVDTTTDITATTLTIIDATGIGTSATDALNLSVDNLAVTTTSGDLYLTEANGIGLGTVNVAANDLNLRAITGNITDNSSDVTAGNLTLTVDATNAAIGASGVGSDINTTLSGTLFATASSGTGGIFISETGDMSVASVDAASGTVELRSTGAIEDATAGADGVTDITAAVVFLNAATGIGAANAIELASQTITADSVGGDINLDNLSASAVDIMSLSTVTGTPTIIFNQTGGGSLTIAAGGTGVATGDSGSNNGGNIIIDNAGVFTVNEVIDTGNGGGSTLNVDGVTLNVSPTLGRGDINLTGTSQDTIVNSDLIDPDTAISLSADRDIIINAVLQTQETVEGTASDRDITLIADTSNNGVGGVWIKADGLVDSVDNVTISGSDIADAGAIAGAGVQIDADSTTDTNQVVADANVTITSKGAAIATGMDIIIDGQIAAGRVSAGTITITANHDILVGQDGAGEADLSSNGGNITLTADNAVGNTGGVIAMTHGGTDGAINIDSGVGTLTLSADGNITLGALATTSTSTSAVGIISTSGSVIDGTSGGATNITASTGGSQITINVGGDIGAVTNIFDETGYVPITTTANDLDLTSGSVIAVSDTASPTLTNLNANSGGAGTLLFTATGDIDASTTTGLDAADTIGLVSTSGTLTLTNGIIAAHLRLEGTDIIRFGGGNLDIDATTALLFKSATDESITISTGQFDGTSGGVLDVTNDSAALELVDLDGDNVAIAQTGPGAITITSTGGSITVTDDVTATSTGSITLFADSAASGDLTVNDVITTDSGDITLRTDNDVVFGAGGDVSSTSGSVEVTADFDGGGVASGALTMADGTIINAGSGTIDLNADGDIALGSLQTSSSSATAVTIDSSEGGIMDAGDSDVDIVADSGTLVINAVTGVGNGNALETTIDALDVDNSTSGNIEIVESNGLTINKLAQGSAGNISLSSITGTVMVAAGQFGVTTVGTGTISLLADGGAAGDLVVNDTINSDSGTITLRADDDVTLGADGDVSSTSGNIEVTADFDSGGAASGALTMADGTIINAGSGTIDLNADEDIALGSLQTSSASVTAVTIDSTEGGVSDAGDSDGDIVAARGTIVINVATGIGVADAIETTAGALNLTTTGSGAAGDIAIADSAALNTSAVTLTTAATTQTIDLTAAAWVVDTALDVGTDNLALRATAGDISDGTAGSGGIALSAATIALDATGAIDATIVTGILAAQSTAAGDIFIENTGALDVNSVAGVSGILTTASAITLESTGSITVSENITSQATGSPVTITSTGGDIIGGGGSVISTGNVTLNAAGGIGIGSALATSAGALNLTTTGIDAAGNITLVDSSAMNTSALTITTAGTAQTVDLTAASWVVGGNLGNATDNLSLTASTGGIEGDAGRLTANQLSLDAATDIGGGTAVNTTATSLNLTTGGADAAGNITVLNSAALNAAAVSLLTAGSNQTIDLSATAWTIDAALNVGTDNLVLRATSGGISDGIVGSGGSALTAATIALDATGGIDVTTVTGTLAAASTSAGDIFIENTGALDVNSVAGVTGIVTTAGAITLESTGTITLSENLSSQATGSPVSITSTAGDIDGGGGTVITTGNVTLSAAGGIGIGSAVVTRAGGLNLTTAGSGAAGNITIVDVASLNTSTVTLVTDATVQAVELTAASWVVGGNLGDATDNLTLRATTGDIEGGAGRLTANALSLDAATDIGGGTAINTSATTLSLTTAGADAAGNISVVDSGALNISAVALITAGSAQTVDLSAASWVVDSNFGNATDSLTLTATTGDIEGGAGRLTANALSLNAATDIGGGIAVDTTATSLNLTTAGVDAAGDIRVVDTGSLDTFTVTLVTDASAQTVELTATSWVVGGDLGSATDNLKLTATTGDIEGGTGRLTANALSLDSATDIGGDSAINTAATALNLTSAGVDAAGNISVVNSIALNTSAVALITAGSAQTVDLTATSWVIDGDLGNATDSLILTVTAGDITAGAGALTAYDLMLIANGSGASIGATGVDAIDTVVTGALTASASNGIGGIYIDQSAALALNTVNAGSGDVELNAGGAITDGNADASGADTTVNITANNLVITGNGAVTDIETSVSSLALTTAATSISNSGALTLNDSTLTGQLDLSNDAAIAFNNLNATGQTVNLTIGGEISGGTITAETLNIVGNNAVTGLVTTVSNLSLNTAATSISNSGALIVNDSTVSGQLDLNAASLALNNIDATGQNVNLSVGLGITDSNGAANNITADSLSLTATQGIGTVADKLETNVSNLSLSNSGSGDMQVVNAGAMNISSVTGSGDLWLQSQSGSITQSGAISIDGEVRVFADVGAITMNKGASTTTSGNKIVYTGSQNVTVAQLNAGAADINVTSQNGNVLATTDAVNITGTGTANIYAFSGAIGTSGAPLTFQSGISVINLAFSSTAYIGGLGSSAATIVNDLRQYETSGGFLSDFAFGNSLVDVAGLQRELAGQVQASADIQVVDADSALLKTETKIFNIVGDGLLLSEDQLEDDEDEDDEEELSSIQDNGSVTVASRAIQG
ncbi:MAG: filamentous hemagglutinin N-terminal domain-containing protein [Candidatus Polarisedimenticolaceae bacterium]|nr:filamentous hemagglutinin N-terminal domain-containing protein [Candidatus Polarisedimenticolaceae bacterium]